MELASQKIEHAPRLASFIEQSFGRIAFVSICLFLVFGWWMSRQRLIAENDPEAIRTTFVDSQITATLEQKKIEQPNPKKIEKKTTEQPIDLTKNPVLNQKVDDTQSTPSLNAPVAPRRVYGLRRVFGVGIGSQGGNADAVIGKLGNTLNADIDTVTATKKDLVGQLVSVTTVTAAPKIAKQVKPEYTKEMLEAKVEGVVKAELLIDVDGKVKQVRIISDFGYNSGEQARIAFMQWEFEPARRGSETVAVWISFAIRFVLLAE